MRRRDRELAARRLAAAAAGARPTARFPPDPARAAATSAASRMPPRAVRAQDGPVVSVGVAPRPAQVHAAPAEVRPPSPPRPATGGWIPRRAVEPQAATPSAEPQAATPSPAEPVSPDADGPRRATPPPAAPTMRLPSVDPAPPAVDPAPPAVDPAPPAGAPAGLRDAAADPLATGGTSPPGALRGPTDPRAPGATSRPGGEPDLTDPLAPSPAVRTLDALRHAADLYGVDAPLQHAAGLPPEVPDRVVHRRPVRWAVGPRAAAVGAVAIALLGGAVALHATASTPGDPVDLPTPGAAATSAPTTQAEVVVDVVGEVAGPGVVRLPTGSRVVDAVAAAGGATRRAQLAALNLARVLVDGEQIVVPRRGAPPAAQATTGVDALVDVNTADVAALDALPGIGPVLAQRIVDERAKHPFSSVDELADVPGIGPSLLARLRPLVRT